VKINSKRTPSTRHAVVLTPSLTGFGNRPSLTQVRPGNWPHAALGIVLRLYPSAFETSRGQLSVVKRTPPLSPRRVRK